jgi:hypothetical protein
MTARHAQIALPLLGALLITAGATWLWSPAALIVAGVLFVAVGVFVIDDGTDS